MNRPIKFKKYYEHIFKSNVKVIKSAWFHLKILINKKREIASPFIILDNEVLTDSTEIANAFNNYFINVFNSPSIIENKFKEYMANSNPCSCFFKPKS